VTTPGDEGRTELAWREIVEHYGERPVLHEDEPAETREPDPAGDEIDVIDEPDDAEDLADEIPQAERFHPPAAPPFPVPRTWQRGVAWSGIMVAPALALVIGLFSIYVHPLVGWALVVWFVGGFLYLVREMPRSPRDPWDDGSRI
jgi:hypothetical protein